MAAHLLKFAGVTLVGKHVSANTSVGDKKLISMTAMVAKNKRIRLISDPPEFRGNLEGVQDEINDHVGAKSNNQSDYRCHHGIFTLTNLVRIAKWENHHKSAIHKGGKGHYTNNRKQKLGDIYK